MNASSKTGPKSPWAKPNLSAYQRAAAFFPEIGMRGDVGDLAEAFIAHEKQVRQELIEDVTQHLQKAAEDWKTKAGEPTAAAVLAAEARHLNAKLQEDTDDA
jgi:hypothetical protein